MLQIERATGCTITAEALKKENTAWIQEYGANPKKSPVENTKAINQAILSLFEAGGGTVEIPEGDFHIYTI